MAETPDGPSPEALQAENQRLRIENETLKNYLRDLQRAIGYPADRPTYRHWVVEHARQLAQRKDRP